MRGSRRGQALPGLLRLAASLWGVFLVLSGSPVRGETFATENDGVFVSFSVADGLSQSTGQDVLQDASGHLWVGTQDGLNLFTGNGFRVFRRDPEDPRSLSDNVIMRLFEDSRKTLWVGTFQGGLNRFDPATGSFQRFSTETRSHPLRSDTVRDLAESPEGELYVATAGGLHLLDPRKDRVRFLPATGDLDIQCLAALPDGSLWMGCSRGLVLRDPKGALTVYPLPAPSLPQVVSLAPGKGEIVLASESDHLFRFDLRTRRFAPHPKRHPLLREAHYLTLLRDSRGALWIGTYDRGLFRDEGPGRRVLRFVRNPEYPGTLAGDAVRRLYEDPLGHLWVGTYFGGVSVFAPERQKFHVVRHDPRDPGSLLDNMVRGFWYDEPRGELWVASLQGVSRWMPREERYRRYSVADGRFPPSLTGHVRGLYRSPDGRLFAFSHRGIGLYDPRRDRFVPYRPSGVLPEGYRPDLAMALHVDRQGNEWIGTAKGVFRRDPKGRWVRFVHREEDPSSLVNDYITRFFEERNGRVWISSESAGASVWTPGREGFETVAHRKGDPRSLGSNNLFCLGETHEALWLGTQGGGLSRLDRRTGGLRTYGIRDGLPNETIYAVLPEERSGALWLSTNRGIVRFDPRRGNVRVFDEHDGVQDREFNNFAYHRSAGGVYFLGGISGFNHFRPEETDRRTPSRGAVLDALLVRGVDRNEAWKLHTAGFLDLPWRDRDLTFVFSPLDLSAGNRIQFQYRLEGYDRAWKQAGSRRVAEYTNLPDGDYVFRLRASNGSGDWGGQGRAYRLRIGVPPWKTPWAFLGYGLGVLALAAGIYGLALLRQGRALRRAEREKARLEGLVEERTEELTRANRELKVLAFRDGLTGLYNRRKFDEVLQAEWVRACRFDRPLAFVMGDIDRFKTLNDQEGHLFGDQVLAAVGEVLAAGIRGTDVLARWGGEEFALLMPETEGDEALAVADRLRRSLGHLEERFGRRVTMSFGVAARGGKDGEAEDLLLRADEALLRAKREGRDRVVPAREAS